MRWYKNRRRFTKKAPITKYRPPKSATDLQKKCQLVLFKPKKVPQTSKNRQFGAFAPALVTLEPGMQQIIMEKPQQPPPSRP